MSRRQTLAPGGATMTTRETTSRVVKYSSTDDQVWNYVKPQKLSNFSRGLQILYPHVEKGDPVVDCMYFVVSVSLHYFLNTTENM